MGKVTCNLWEQLSKTPTFGQACGNEEVAKVVDTNGCDDAYQATFALNNYK